MSNFWPDGLSINNVRTPYEILESAREEWETATEGILTLVFQKSEPEVILDLFMNKVFS